MRNLFIVLLLLSIALPDYGQEVELEMARQVAHNFHLQSLKHLDIPPVRSKLSLTQTKKAAGLPSYYIFNAEKNQGFVLVSATYNRPPIVGFSHYGNFDADHLPPALGELLDEYENRTDIRAAPGKEKDQYKQLWDQYAGTSLKAASSNEEEIPVVGPLLRSRWDQGCYYNMLCPEDSEGPCGHVRVGCVAVAMAQIMNYYEFPEKGRDSSSYTHETYGLLSANFENTEYHWDNMPNKLFSENEPVAKLLSHCGVSIGMDYGPSVSWGSTYRAALAMINNFYYSDNILFDLYDSTRYTREVWGDAIRYELDNYRPVSSSGPPPDHGEQHGYVIDGYYGADLLHYNWGWGGSSDGYFPVGGSFIILGIQPEPCKEDSLNPNLVENLSFAVDADTIEVSWNRPKISLDGDYAFQYRLVKENTHDFMTRDSLFRFTWDTLGTYRIKIQSFDDCMHPSERFAELDVFLSDSINYHPRLKVFEPSNGDTVVVYPGVFKFFEVSSTDPNGDLLSYSWTFDGQALHEGVGAKIAHNFNGLDSGIHSLEVSVSDDELSSKGHWLVEIQTNTRAIIDDIDSLSLSGDWNRRISQDAYGLSFLWARRNMHMPSTAYYIYAPQLTGTYAISAYVPFMTDLTFRASYIPMVDGVPLDTFQVDQNSTFGSWVHLGNVDLQASSELLVQVENSELIYQRSYLALDALEINYLGLMDHTPPEIAVVDSIYQSDYVNVTSTEDGVLFLVPQDTEKEISLIQKVCMDSVQVQAFVEVHLSIAGLENGEYWLYATDSAQNVSESKAFKLMGVGVHNHKSDQYLSIYPNPTGQSISIRTNVILPYELMITSLKGQILFSAQCNESVHFIDLSSFQKGVYLIRIRSKQTMRIKRIIKL